MPDVAERREELGGPRDAFGSNRFDQQPALRWPNGHAEVLRPFAEIDRAAACKHAK